MLAHHLRRGVCVGVLAAGELGATVTRFLGAGAALCPCRDGDDDVFLLLADGPLWWLEAGPSSSPEEVVFYPRLVAFSDSFAAVRSGDLNRDGFADAVALTAEAVVVYIADASVSPARFGDAVLIQRIRGRYRPHSATLKCTMLVAGAHAHECGPTLCSLTCCSGLSRLQRLPKRSLWGTWTPTALRTSLLLHNSTRMSAYPWTFPTILSFGAA